MAFQTLPPLGICRRVWNPKLDCMKATHYMNRISIMYLDIWNGSLFIVVMVQDSEQNVHHVLGYGS